MKKVKIITLFLFLFASSSNFALTPPIPPEELMQDADVVMEGEVTGEVKCLEKTTDKACYNRLDYQTEITPSKIIKGKTKKKKAIEVHFFHNDYSKSKCTGDQGASLHQGDIGTFYLKKSDKGYYYPFHWNAFFFDDFFGFGISEYALQSIANFNSHFSIVECKEQEYAVVLSFFSDFPTVKELLSEVFYGKSIQILDGDYRHFDV